MSEYRSYRRPHVWIENFHPEQGTSQKKSSALSQQQRWRLSWWITCLTNKLSATISHTKPTITIKQTSENKRGQAAARLISFLLITSNQSESWFELLDWWGPKALKHQTVHASSRQQAKVMPYHIWHPKAGEIDPPLLLIQFRVWTHTLAERGRKGQEQDLILAQFFCHGNRWSPTMREIITAGSCAEHSMRFGYVNVSVSRWFELCSWCWRMFMSNSKISLA